MPSSNNTTLLAATAFLLLGIAHKSDAGIGAIGGDGFDYPEGDVVGRDGGRGWDANNLSHCHTFTHSDWDVISGTVRVAAGALVTDGSGAQREFNGPGSGSLEPSDELAGSIRAEGSLYFKVEMLLGAGAQWGGMSSREFGYGRLSFGVPDSVGLTGEREFGIEIEGAATEHSGIIPVAGQSYTLAAKIDFDNDLLSLWVDPDLGAEEDASRPAATLTYAGDDWVSAVGLASVGEVAWDKLAIGCRWEELRGWSKLGNDIDGEADRDSFVESIAFSADGRILAVGASGDGDNGSSSGHVRVFAWAGSDWMQLGVDINGEGERDLFGRALALSADGSRLAVGAPGNDGNGSDSGHVRVFSWDGKGWIQLGADIDGEAGNEGSGTALAMTADGSRLAIGAPGSNGDNLPNSGLVRVYSWDGSFWVPLGNNIHGENENDGSGGAVALSADGMRLAVGAVFFRDTAGQVRVFQWDGGDWSPLGEGIEGEGDFAAFGGSVALSTDGSIVAAGAIGGSGNGPDPGYARVYAWNGSTWVQRGADIDGEAESDFSGRSVGLSGDGLTLAVGAPNNDGNGRDSGHVRLFRWGGDTWAQLGSDIDGEGQGDAAGTAALSADGSRLAVGSLTRSGKVRVYGDRFFAEPANAGPLILSVRTTEDGTTLTWTNFAPPGCSYEIEKSIDGRIWIHHSYVTDTWETIGRVTDREFFRVRAKSP